MGSIKNRVRIEMCCWESVCLSEMMVSMLDSGIGATSISGIVGILVTGPQDTGSTGPPPQFN